MKLTSENLYIGKSEKGYEVRIEMPDSSRNYLHCEAVKDLQEAIWIMQDFDGQYEIEEVYIREDGTYFRLEIDLSDGRGKQQHFHSRKLNLNDAIHERRLLLENDS